LAAFHSLREFDIYAADGHFWEAATHDEKSYKRGSKDNPAKFITGNIFALCLRNHRLRHLTLADKRLTRPQHDLSALKRLDTNALRLDAGKGRKVLYVYDRAIIDFGLWAQIKRHGIYIITRNKANLALQTCAQLTWDQAEALNAGVLADTLVGASGHMVRKIAYRDPLSDEIYEFLTNLTDTQIAPGLIAMLYKMRWDVDPRRLAGAEMDGR
jgi:hypothetical protein